LRKREELVGKRKDGKLFLKPGKPLCHLAVDNEWEGKKWTKECTETNPD